MMVYTGIVKDNVIVLPEEVQLEEGTRVEVRALSGNEQTAMHPSEMAFQQLLVEKGLLKRIKTPTRIRPEGDRTPVVIEGALSQAIIEDRR